MQRWVLLFALWTSALSNFGIILLQRHWIGADFSVFWHAVRSGFPYAPSLTPFLYPPTTLIWLQPLRLVPFWFGYALLSLLSAATYFVTVRRLWGWRIAGLSLFAPTAALGLVPGQLGMLTCALVFLAYSITRWRGVLLAVAFTLKPQIVFVAPIFLLVDRDWRNLGLMACTTALLAVAATLLLGRSSWSEWLDATQRLHAVLAERGMLRIALSPTQFVQGFGLTALPVLLICAICSIAMAFTRCDEPTRACLVGCASLSATPYALRYDLVALTPLFAHVMVSSSSSRSVLAALSFTGVMGPFALIAGWLLGRSASTPSSLGPAAETAASL